MDSLWYCGSADTKFTFKVIEAFNVTVGKLFGVGVKAALYLGDTLIGKEEYTLYRPPTTNNPQWNDVLEFDACLKVATDVFSLFVLFVFVYLACSPHTRYFFAMFVRGHVFFFWL